MNRAYLMRTCPQLLNVGMLELTPFFITIAIEPYGAVTNLGKAYRTPKAKADFFTLFDKFACGEKLATAEEEHYVIAVLVRGGVFGESGKE